MSDGNITVTPAGNGNNGTAAPGAADADRNENDGTIFHLKINYSVRFCSAWDFLVHVLLGLIFLQAKSAMLFLQKIIRIAL